MTSIAAKQPNFAGALTPPRRFRAWARSTLSYLARFCSPMSAGERPAASLFSGRQRATAGVAGGGRTTRRACASACSLACSCASVRAVRWPLPARVSCGPARGPSVSSSSAASAIALRFNAGISLSPSSSPRARLCAALLSLSSLARACARLSVSSLSTCASSSAPRSAP